jgi:hypothetical protein
MPWPPTCTGGFSDTLLGRVEILALLVLLYPCTWYKRP